MPGNRHCAVESTVRVIGGKWKPLILYFLFFEGTQRFNALQRQVGAPRQALTVQLRELEQDGIIERRVFAEVPPRVEYSLTSLGRSLGPVLQGMLEWGERYERERPPGTPGPASTRGGAGT